MKINKEHIDQLYTFTEKHYVEWYDLQTELVDHLANDIEKIWEENPDLSFIEAREISFKKFGVIGFSDVIQKRQGALQQKYWLLIWNIFKEFFQLPKIILFVFLVLLTYNLLNTIAYNDTIILICFFAILIYMFTFVYVTFKKIKRNRKATGKKWLFENIVASLGGLSFMANIPLQVYALLIQTESVTDLSLWATSCLLVLLGIFVYIATQIIPKKMDVYMLKNYPKYQPIT